MISALSLDRIRRSAFPALSVSDAAEDVIAVIRAGARGYVTKTISAEDLADAVRRVAGGDAVFSPRLAGFVLDAFAEDQAPAGRTGGRAELDQLTPREREVLRHIARGYMYKEIAQRARHLGQDRRGARLRRTSQAPALQPSRAEPLGDPEAPRQPRLTLLRRMIYRHT